MFDITELFPAVDTFMGKEVCQASKQVPAHFAFINQVTLIRQQLTNLKYKQYDGTKIIKLHFIWVGKPRCHSWYDDWALSWNLGRAKRFFSSSKCPDQL